MDKDTPPKSLIAPYMRPLTPVLAAMQPAGALQPPLECLLCDIYGTLFISGSGDLDVVRRQSPPLAALAQVLKRYQLTLRPDLLVKQLHQAIEKYHQKAKSQGVACPEIRIEKIWEQLLPGKDEAELKRFAIEFEMVVNPVWPMPHLPELLSACRQNHLKLGAISNAQFFTPYLFDWFLGRSMTGLGFDKELILFSFDFGEAKPSVRLFETALRRLRKMGIDRRRTAYIGNDMRKDIAPAKKTGFQTILFAGDARSLRMEADPSTADPSTPDLVVTDLQQLIKYLS